MSHNIALVLAIALFLAGKWAWETFRSGGFRRSSPTPPIQAEIDAPSQVSELPPVPDHRQGRGATPQIGTSPTGVMGAWIRPSDDDDD